jgi:hypothetical protein
MGWWCGAAASGVLVVIYTQCKIPIWLVCLHKQATAVCMIILIGEFLLVLPLVTRLSNNANFAKQIFGGLLILLN